MDQVMALLWVGTGAVAIVVAGGSWGRVVAASALVVCLLWLAVPPVQARSTTIDSPRRPVVVTCESALGALESEPFMLIDTGRVFSPADAPCRAAAWHRVAALGSGELGVALLLWLRRTSTSRRHTTDTASAGAR